MPNGSGDASLLSGTLPTPKVKDLIAANACFRTLFQANTSITINNILFAEIRLIACGDASLGNASGGGSQICHMICAAHSDIPKGKSADVSLLMYKSHKMTRAGSSTRLVESNAMSEALADTEWVAFL